MYAADKYMVPQFYTSTAFLRYLDNELCVTNVCTLLDYSLQYTVTMVTEACIHYIASKAAEVFQSEGFLNVSKEALGMILGFPTLLCKDESHVYKAWVRWADAKRSRKCRNVTTDGDSTARDICGDVVYKVRLPILKPKCVSELMKFDREDEFLSAKDKIDLLVYMLSKDCQEGSTIPDLFSIVPRQYQACHVDRLLTKQTPDDFALTSTQDVLYFTVDSPILLFKITIHPGKFKYFETGIISLLADDGMILANVNLNTNEQVVYMRPIRLEGETRYTILAKLYKQRSTLPLKNNNSTNKDKWPLEHQTFKCGNRSCYGYAPARVPVVPEPETPPLNHGPEQYHVTFNFNFTNLPLTCSTNCRFKGGNIGVLDKFYYIKL